MGKITRFMIAVIALAGIFATSASAPAEAFGSLRGFSMSAAGGEWMISAAGVSGQEIPMEELAFPNSTWLQLLSDGVTISGPSEICHPFRGGQFGWTGIIYQLDGETWQKLDTTAKWYPDPAGEYIACATAPSAGTYALFGFYQVPQIEKCKSPYSISSLDAYVVGDNGYIYFGTISPAAGNVKVTYKLTNITPTGAITGALTASTLTDAEGSFTFSEPFFINFETLTGFRQKFFINGCELTMSIS